MMSDIDFLKLDPFLQEQKLNYQEKVKENEELMRQKQLKIEEERQFLKKLQQRKQAEKDKL